MNRPNSSGSNKSAVSDKSKASDNSTASVESILSDDSYAATFKDVDKDFEKLLANTIIPESGRTILEERKTQKHEVKKRDANDTEKRSNWTAEMEREHAEYKAAVKKLNECKSVYMQSEFAAKRSKDVTIEIQEKLRMKALEDGYVWLAAGIEAGQLRLAFMIKYKDAFSTPSTNNHIIAAKDNLNSAKDAQFRINVQKQKIAEIPIIAALREGAKAKKAAAGNATGKAAAGSGDKAAAGNATKAAAGSGDKLAAGNATKAAAGSADKAAAGSGNKAAASNATKPAAGSANKPAAGSGNKAAAGNATKGSATKGQK